MECRLFSLNDSPELHRMSVGGREFVFTGCERAKGRFAATTFLLYDPQRETMEVICAGQFPPWRWRNDTWEPTPVPSMLALGIFKLGAIINPMLPVYRGRELRHMLRVGETKV